MGKSKPKIMKIKAPHFYDLIQRLRHLNCAVNCWQLKSSVNMDTGSGVLCVDSQRVNLPHKQPNESSFMLHLLVTVRLGLPWG